MLKRNAFHINLIILSIVQLCFVSSSDAAVFRRRSFFSQPRSNFFVNNFTGNQFFNNRFRNGFGFNNFNNDFNVGGNFGFNNSFVDPRQTREVAGFGNLRQAGNKLVELDQFGQARRLFIDQGGNLRGASEAKTVQQLKEFYLVNRDKFRGNDKVVVDRFLARQGALNNGRFLVDIENFAMNPEIEALLKSQGGDIRQRRREFGLAALNYFLNSIQGQFKLRIPPGKVRADGTVELNLSPFLRGEVLAFLQASDPQAACNGGKFRLNKMINFSMDPSNYYRIINAPNNCGDVSRAFGVQDDKSLSSGNKIVIGKDEKGVRESGVATGDQRILEVQTSLTVPGASCYRSLDTQNVVPGGAQAESRNVFINGINFTHDAEERLCLTGNGFMQTFLCNGQGQLLKEAPGSIANGDRLNGPQINNAIGCLNCHANGFIGGGVKHLDGKPQKDGYTEQFFNLNNELSRQGKNLTQFRDSSGRLLRHGDFFTTNKNYLDRAKRDSEIFRRARQETGSEVIGLDKLPFPVLPEMFNSYRGGDKLNITAKNAAIELGLGDSEAAANQARALIGGEQKDRTLFDSQFCKLKAGSSSPLNEAEQRLILQTQQNGVGIGGGSFPVHR